MKIKEIASLCKKSKRIYIYNVSDAKGEIVTQWIGNGSAIYPLYNMSYLDKKTVLQIFDIPEDKQSDYFFYEMEELPEGINFSDTDELEVEAEKFGFPLLLSGAAIQPITVADSIAFFDLKYFAPAKSNDYCPCIFERVTEKGNPYFVLKVGLIIVGIVMGYDAVTKHITEHLENLAAKTRQAFEDKRAKEDTIDINVFADETDEDNPENPVHAEPCPEGKIITLFDIFGDLYKKDDAKAQSEGQDQIKINELQSEEIRNLCEVRTFNEDGLCTGNSDIEVICLTCEDYFKFCDLSSEDENGCRGRRMLSSGELYPKCQRCMDLFSKLKTEANEDGEN